MPASAKGLVTMLYIQEPPGVMFKLDAEPKPKDGWYYIQPDHPQAATLFSLVSLAAIHRLPLRARVYGSEIKASEWGRLQWACIEDFV